MFGSRFTSLWWRSSALRSRPVTGAARRCVAEQLEGRQLLSASLVVENTDIIPGYERMVFTKIAVLDDAAPNTFKDSGVLRLRNFGDEPLVFSNTAVQGPFRVAGAFPTSIAPGASADVRIEFTATSTPSFTYNQTAGFSNPRDGGAHIGSLAFATNDPANATFTEGLAGWFQKRSERNNEPSLQTIVNLLLDYQTNIAPPQTVVLSQESEPVYYGEEVVSAHWQQANPGKSIGVRQVAAYHSQGDSVPVYWHSEGSSTNNLLFRHDGAASQTLLPNILGGTGAAFGSFSTSTTFGFRVDKSFSDDSRNPRPQFGGGHEVRFFPVRDHFGNLLANTYFMVQDYSIPVNGIPPNFDFQDNLYIVTNIMPAGAVPPPLPTIPPVIPPTVPPTVPPTDPPVDPPTEPPIDPPTEPPVIPPVDPVPGPTVSITPTSLNVVEAATGIQMVQLTVSLSEPMAKKAKVRFTTDSGTATRRADFGRSPGQLKFAPGQTEKTITVKVKSDTIVEGDENFAVSLYGPRNVAIGNDVSIVTIQDSGVGGPTVPAEALELPRISIAPVTPSIVEGNSGKQFFAFNVTIDGNPGKKVKLKYATVDGTATKGSDFKGKKGNLGFPNGGVTSRTINIPVKGDSTVEADEDFFVTLFNIKNGEFANDTAQAIIQNDDAL